MSHPIIDFIEARLEEDRALAQAAIDDLYGEDDCFFDTSNAHICDHYLHHQPSRVLREVNAKRAILAAHAEYARTDPHDCIRRAWYERETLCWVIQQMAAAHSTHKDFREEWAA